MRKSIIQGLNELDMQVVVNTYNLNPFYFPTVFPLKFTPSLTWKEIQGKLGIPIMADVSSFDSRAPRKRRQVAARNQGDIPKISVGRDKDESAINEYNQLKAYAGTDAGAEALLEFIYDDPEFVWTGVNARIEWLALQAGSTGRIKLTEENNAGVVTEADVTFLIPAENKQGVATAITPANVATSKPITMIKDRLKFAKSAGFRANYIFTDPDTIENILMADETIKYVAPWVAQATRLTETPTLESLNTALRAKNLPQLIAIDQLLTFEDKAGKRTPVEPWEKGVLHFSQDKVLGTTWYGPLADQTVDSPALKVLRKHVLIKKFAQEEPLVESTVGMANAFPALANSQNVLLVDTLNTTWKK